MQVSLPRTRSRRLAAAVSGAAVVFALVASGAARADDVEDVAKLLQAGRSADALRTVEQRLSKKPDDVQLRFLRGVALAEQNRTTEAVAVFNKLVQDHPELPEPYNNLAVLYANMGQYDRARNSLETAIRTNPTYATAHENLGDLYAMLASQSYSKAMQLDAGNTRAAPKLALIRDIVSNKGQQPPAVAARTPEPAPAPRVLTNPSAIVPLPPAPVIAAAPAPAPAPVERAAEKAADKAADRAAARAAEKAAEKAAAEKALADRAAERQAERAAAKAAEKTAEKTTEKSEKTLSPAEAEVLRAVEAWADAWSRKDLKAYFAAYSSSYTGDAASREAWEDNRRARIMGKRSIQVKVSEVKVDIKGAQATAVFRQFYKGDTLATKSRKTLKLVQQGGQWRIESESSGSGG